MSILHGRQEHPIRFFALTSRLHNAADVSAVLRILLAHGDELTPTVYGYTDPIRSKVDVSRLDKVGKGFSGGGMLSMQAPSAQLTLSNHIPDYTFGVVILSLTRHALQSAQLSALVCEISRLLQPELGIVHLLNDHDLEADTRKGLRVNGCIPEPSFGLHHKDLKLGLPEFYWGMVFGKPYAGMFGESRLKQVPAARVESPADGVVYVQLTDDIADCWDDAAKLRRARDAAKEHLGRPAFMHDELRFDDLGNAKLPWLTRLLSPKPLVPDLRP